MLQMLIIGGGIHGTHLAHCLLHHTPLIQDDIRILDPHEEWMHEWWRCTRNCGMRYLRSPSVHHIDINPFSLDKFAVLPENRQESNFIAPKDRPSVELFHKHCHMVIDSHRLESLRIKGTALELKNHANHVSVVTEDQTIDTRMILLAVGMNNQPLWPHHAILLKGQNAPVHHDFDPDFRLNAIQNKGPIAVVGSGISGAQLALQLAEKGFHLKTAPCGFPVIGPSLRWHERIYVSGPLSELQIGPCARNIAGARHSGRRITAALNKESIPSKSI